MGSFLLVKGTAQDRFGKTVNCDGIAAPSGFIVPDVSLNRDRLGTFVRFLNAGRAEEVQLMELVEDFVNEEQMMM